MSAGVNITRGRRKNHNRTQTLDRSSSSLFTYSERRGAAASLYEINPYQLSVCHYHYHHHHHHHRHHHCYHPLCPRSPSRLPPPSSLIQTNIVALTSLAANGERILSSSRDLLIARTIRRHEPADWFLFRPARVLCATLTPMESLLSRVGIVATETTKCKFVDRLRIYLSGL